MQLNPNSLPDIQVIRKRAQSLAMIEAIVSPDWVDRYFSFNSEWSDGEEMASMRNGQGDDWFMLFGPFGAAIKGLAHESKLADNNNFAAAVQLQVPKSFSSFLQEPAFSMDWLSYCYWRSPEDKQWQKVKAIDSALVADDGSTEFLALLIKPALSYVQFANEYYEVKVPLESVELIYQHEPLTAELIHSINPELSIADAKTIASEIGYTNTKADV